MAHDRVVVGTTNIPVTRNVKVFTAVSVTEISEEPRVKL